MPDDEPALMRRLAELVTQYGRYDHRRIGGSPNPGGSAGTCLPLRQLSAILVRMPKKRTAGPAPLSEQLRKAIDASGHTRYAIAKETGISQSTLSRFMSGERGLPLATIDTLAGFLGLNITTRPTEFSAADDGSKA